MEIKYEMNQQSCRKYQSEPWLAEVFVSTYVNLNNFSFR